MFLPNVTTPVTTWNHNSNPSAPKLDHPDIRRMELPWIKPNQGRSTLQDRDERYWTDVPTQLHASFLYFECRFGDWYHLCLSGFLDNAGTLNYWICFFMLRSDTGPSVPDTNLVKSPPSSPRTSCTLLERVLTLNTVIEQFLNHNIYERGLVSFIRWQNEVRNSPPTLLIP